MTKSEEIMVLRGFAVKARTKGNTGTEHPEWPIAGHISAAGLIVLFVSAYAVRRYKSLMKGDLVGDIDLEAIRSETSFFIHHATRAGWKHCYEEARIFAQKVFYFPDQTKGGDVYDYRRESDV